MRTRSVPISTDVVSGLQHSETSFTDKHGQLTELGVRVGSGRGRSARDLPDEPPGPPLEIAFFNLIAASAATFAARRRGLVVLVDEAQDCDQPSLISLCRVQHQLRKPAFQLVLAGLPELEDAIDEAITHSDRLFEYRELGNLDREATREALLEPAAVHGVRLDRRGRRLRDRPLAGISELRAGVRLRDLGGARAPAGDRSRPGPGGRRAGQAERGPAVPLGLALRHPGRARLSDRTGRRSAARRGPRRSPRRSVAGRAS